MTVAERRDLLLAWITVWGPCDASHCATYARGAGADFLYVGHGSRDRCVRDLEALENAGKLHRLDGHPARWRAA